MMDEQTIYDVAVQAFTQLIASEVSGSLLALSVILNAVLLAPYVVKSLRASWKGN